MGQSRWYTADYYIRTLIFWKNGFKYYKTGQVNKMRTLHLMGHFLPDSSGSTTRLYYLLSKLPSDILLIASDTTVKGNKIELKEEHLGNITIKRAPIFSDKGLFGVAPLRYLHTIYQKPRAIISQAKAEQFDIIHAHNSSIYGQTAQRLSKKTGKPFLVEVHAPVESSVSAGRGNIKAFYLERMTRNLLKSCHCVIALTQGLKVWISDNYEVPLDKIKVVPNGVDINEFSPTVDCQKKAEEMREKLGLLKNVVMYAGRMDRINGMVDLAEVIPLIIRQKPETSFVFIGHGPEENRIMALCEKHHQVKFLPTVHYSEMPIYYQVCDVFVIPRPSTISSETVTPLKLLEVMAMEKPVLGSNVGGITELIKHGENGYLFEKDDRESFMKTLQEVLDGSNTQVGKKARQTIVENNYTWDKSAKILQKVYQDLV